MAKEENKREEGRHWVWAPGTWVLPFADKQGGVFGGVDSGKEFVFDEIVIPVASEVHPGIKGLMLRRGQGEG